MGFQDRVVLVNGGTRGIGREIVFKFARAGAVVLFTYLKSRELCEGIEKQLSDEGLKAKGFIVNSTDYDSVGELVTNICCEYKKIDVLINNAGVVEDQILPIMKKSQWDNVINVNLNGYFNFCRHVSEQMVYARKGNIINISSVSGMRGIRGQCNYSASKAAVIGLTKSLSLELAGKKIRVNAVAPGYIKTEMTDELHSHQIEHYCMVIPLKRLGTAEEVADLVMFLASDEASYITGQVFVIDGGLSV